MTKHKHTPGPWEKARGFMGRTEIVSANERDTSDPLLTFTLARDIGGRVHGADLDDYSEVEANESLITAAPDLLTALEEVSASLAWVSLGRCRAMEDPPIMPPEMAIELARAAIVKATA